MGLILMMVWCGATAEHTHRNDGRGGNVIESRSVISLPVIDRFVNSLKWVMTPSSRLYLPQQEQVQSNGRAP